MVDFLISETKSTSSDRDDICNVAKTWLNTPYQHQCMVKGENGGVDCVKLIAGIAIECQMITKEDVDRVPPYHADWHINSSFPKLTETLKQFGVELREDQVIQPGDILAFTIGKTVSHLGVYIGDNYFIHAEGRGPKKVTITTLSGPWLKRLTQVYKFPGVK